MTDSHHIEIKAMPLREPIPPGHYEDLITIKLPGVGFGVALARNADFANIVVDALICLIARDGAQEVANRLNTARRGR